MKKIWEKGRRGLAFTIQDKYLLFVFGSLLKKLPLGAVRFRRAEALDQWLKPCLHIYTHKKKQSCAK